jgi:Flp pilus assembly pilin Flp
MSALVRLLRDETGGPLVEYALVLALLSMVAIVALGAIATSADGALTRTQAQLTSAAVNFPTMNTF